MEKAEKAKNPKLVFKNVYIKEQNGIETRNIKVLSKLKDRGEIPLYY